MRAYDFLLASPVIALIAIAVLSKRSSIAFGKISLPREDRSAAPPAISRVDTDAAFLKTISWEGNLAARTKSAPMPSSRDSALAAPMKCDGAAAAGLTGVRLVDLSGTHKKRSFPIPAIGVTIGRSPYAAEIVLGNPRVSSRHAWIGFVSGKPVLRDLDSTNGTFLNGQLNLPVTETALRSGDTISFGNHRGEQFRFEME